MKHHLFLIAATLGTLLFCASNNKTHADPDPFNPVGTLEVNPIAVQTGIKPNLDWEIEYPEIITNLITIDPDDSITTKKKLRMDVRVVGAAWSDGRRYYYVNSYIKVHGSWSQLFYGTQTQINPSIVRYSEVLDPDTRVDFAGRGNLGGSSWSSWKMTTSESYNVQALVNGDSIPDYVPAHDQGNIESFLTQFVDDTGTIILGPYDVIYLYDFNSYGSSGFDLQDLVIVVTFTEVD